MINNLDIIAFTVIIVLAFTLFLSSSYKELIKVKNKAQTGWQAKLINNQYVACKTNETNDNPKFTSKQLCSEYCDILNQ